MSIDVFCILPGPVEELLIRLMGEAVEDGRMHEMLPCGSSDPYENLKTQFRSSVSPGAPST